MLIILHVRYCEKFSINRRSVRTKETEFRAQGGLKVSSARQLYSAEGDCYRTQTAHEDEPQGNYW